MRAYNFTQLGESATNPTYTNPTADDDLVTKLYADTIIAGAGGGGGSILWGAPDGNAPLFEEEFSNNVWKFIDGGSQELWAIIKVPQTYSGAQIKLFVEAYSSSTSNTWKLEATAYLVRSGTDAANSTTNSHASTNSNVTNDATQYKSNAVELDLTDADGEINSIAVSAGDSIRVKLTRASGTTDTADVRLIDGAAELKTT